MSNDAELIESTIQTIAHLTHSSNTLQDKLRADAANGECAKSTNLTMIAAADRIDELEKKCKQLDESESQLIEQRDHWEEKATELANDVGAFSALMSASIQALIARLSKRLQL